MDEKPPTLDYQPPPPRGHSVGAFVGGIMLGFILPILTLVFVWPMPSRVAVSICMGVPLAIGGSMCIPRSGRDGGLGTIVGALIWFTISVTMCGVRF